MNFKAIAILAILPFILLMASSSQSDMIKEHQHFHPIHQSHAGYYSFIPYIEVDGVKSSLPLTSPQAKIVIDFYGQPMTIELRRNDHLISGNFRHSHQEKGQTIRHDGLYESFCHYHGKIQQSLDPQVSDLDHFYALTKFKKLLIIHLPYW